MKDLSIQELAGKMLDIISETRATAHQSAMNGELDTYAYNVTMRLASGLNKLEMLCKEYLTESEASTPVLSNSIDADGAVTVENVHIPLREIATQYAENKVRV